MPKADYFILQGLITAETAQRVAQTVLPALGAGLTDMHLLIASGGVLPLSEEPFTLTYQENPTEVERRFRKWVNDRIILSLDRWRKALGA